MFSKRIFPNLNKTLVIQTVSDEIKFSSQYFILLIFSVIIATLGLIINNSVIVIGAMILSPMIWPLMGLALSTVITRRKILRKSALLLFLSIIVTIATAALISFLLPFKEADAEILSRINPTLFDLIIALAAGFAACLVLIWPKYTEHTAGVAVAAALLPPVCITGIGVALWDYKIASGSFILFLTNLASILFASILVFTFAKFYKREGEETKQRITIGLALSFIVLIALGFQFYFSFKQIIYENDIEARARAILSQELSDISGEIRIDNISINTSSLADNKIGIEADVRTPEDALINISQKQKIIDNLQENINKDINLTLRITKVLEAYTPDIQQLELKNLQSRAQEILIENLSKISPDIQVQTMNMSACLEESSTCKIETVLRVPEDIDITYQNKDEIVSNLSASLLRLVDLKISIINYSHITKEPEVTEIAKNQEILEQLIENFINERRKDTGIYLNDYNIEFIAKKLQYSIILDLNVPVLYETDDTYLDDLRKAVKEEFGTVSIVDFAVRYFRYEE